MWFMNATLRVSPLQFPVHQRWCHPQQKPHVISKPVGINLPLAYTIINSFTSRNDVLSFAPNPNVHCGSFKL